MMLVHREDGGNHFTTLLFILIILKDSLSTEVFQQFMPVVPGIPICPVNMECVQIK